MIKSSDNSTPDSLRERRRETLFIDARKMGTLIDRVHCELTDNDLAKIVNTYHAWRGDVVAGGVDPGKSGLSATAYKDIPGFCESATTDDIAQHGCVLTPGCYVGAEEIEDEGEPFEEKMKRLTAELEEQFAESSRLERAIRQNLNTFSTFPNESAS